MFWGLKWDVKRKNDFCNLLEGYKKINEKDDIVTESKGVEYTLRSGNYMKTKQELEKPIKDIILKYKDIIFGVDSLACVTCLVELRKQQVIDEEVYDQKLIGDAVRKLTWDELQKNIVIDHDMMIDRRTGEVLYSLEKQILNRFCSLYRP